MKIVFLSDIHGNKYVLPSFFSSLQKENPDKVVFCGDIFGYYYYQNEIIDEFRKCQFKVLLGNHDQYFLDIIEGKIAEEPLVKKYGNSYKDILNKIAIENVDYIRSLSSSYEFDADGYRFGVFHGSPLNPLKERIYPDTDITNPELYGRYDYVVLGHTHHKMERKVGNAVVLNPGSIGQQRDGKGCSYLVVDTTKCTYNHKIIEYNVTKLINDIEKFDNGNTRLLEVLLRKK